MKKIILLVFTIVLLTGCNKTEEEQPMKALLCQNDSEKYVFNYDEDNIIDAIYFEKTFDFNHYYKEYELEEFKKNKFMLTKIIEEQLIDCNNKKYSCNSEYKDYIITNKIYVNNNEEARLSSLDKYYGIDYSIISANVNTNFTCKEIIQDEKYVVKGNETKITINNDIYTSINEMNKPAYYKEYTLYENEGKKITINFKDNGKCELNLKEFNSQSWNKVYCDSNKNKKIMTTTYLDGNCSYSIRNNYYFDVIYDGKCEIGSYCENSDDLSSHIKYDVVNNANHKIQIQFDENYNEFKFLNGGWGRKYQNFGHFEYSKSHINN